MKKLILSVVLISCFQTNAQSFIEAYEATRIIEPYNNVNGTDSYDGYLGNPQEWSKIMGILGEFDDIEFNRRGTDGTVYLFDNWENKGVVDVGEKRYVVTNLNYHIKRDEFMMKMEGDSTFIFDLLRVDKFSVNNREFTNIYDPVESKNKIYEVLYQDQKRSLLKGYFVKYKEASPNPMVNRGRNEIKQGHSYFMYENGKLLPFRLKKSKTLDLVSIDQSKQLELYIKTNDLSYRKEMDMVKILDQISKI